MRIECPLLTVITVCRNPGATLLACLRSVAEQTLPELEHVVIDGASSDETPALLAEAQASWHPRLRWLSESDAGIADAMNKGVLRARGEWVLFLHADDGFLDPESAGRIRVAIAGAVQGLVAFPIVWRGPITRTHRPAGTPLYGRFKLPYPHQGLVARRELFSRVGPFDASFRIAMDYDWELRCLGQGVRVRVERQAYSFMGGFGVGSSQHWTLEQLRLEEEQRVRLRHASGQLERALLGGLFPLYMLYRRGRQSFRRRSVDGEHSP